MALTKNQQDCLDHTKKNGCFATCAKGQDFNDCETLYREGFLTRVDAAPWMGDSFIYYPTSKKVTN